MNECEVYFRISGDSFDPDDITKRLGITPSKTALAGIPTPKYSSWVLSTGYVCDKAIDVYDLSSALVAHLEPKTDEIKALLEEFKLHAVLQVVLRISMNPSESMPAIGFSQQVIDFLSKAGASIDVDTYRQES